LRGLREGFKAALNNLEWPPRVNWPRPALKNGNPRGSVRPNHAHNECPATGRPTHFSPHLSQRARICLPRRPPPHFARGLRFSFL